LTPAPAEDESRSGLATEHWERVAEAFSRKAPEYEALWTDHPHFTRMRNRVHEHFDSLVAPGARVLELNAGMGIDAVRMVRRGHRVHATDVAPGMTSVIEEKSRAPDLKTALTVQRCSYTDLNRVQAGPFDAVFSNFGGLNCVDDLRIVTRQLGNLLVPGAVVTWVIMPPICPWEWLALLRGDWRTATRRLHRGGVMAHVAGVHFRTFYFTPSQVLRAFGPAYRLVRLEGLSLFAPPADHKEFVTKHPRLYRALVYLDARVATLPLFRGWGDFFILSVRYQGT
jgi:SAM-dependent methyltransferase